MTYLFLALISLPTNTWAFGISRIPASCLAHKTDFIPAEEELKRLSLSLQMMKASPLLKVFDQNGKMTDQCSSAVVSDAGHILTVGHCIESCLARAGAYRQQGAFSEPDPEKLKQVTCTVEINGKKTDVGVLAISKCRQNQRFTPGSAAFCKGSDFAILEMRDPSQNPKSCFKVSGKSLQSGDEVAAIGYPVKSSRVLFRESARDSDGVGQFISTGKLIAPQLHCFKKTDPNSAREPGVAKFTTPEIVAAQDYLRSGDLVQSTVDTLKGSSGGPLILQSTGELVGVATLYARDNGPLLDCEGSTFFGTFGMIQRRLREDFPQIDTKKVFGCSLNSAQNRVKQTDL